MESKPTITYDDFAKLDLRVATILAAEDHPNADRLLKLQIDLGDEQRQICAGVKSFYSTDQLVGKQVIVVSNLAARRIRGEQSEGMLLAASVTQGEALSDIVIVEPSRAVPAGALVS